MPPSTIYLSSKAFIHSIICMYHSSIVYVCMCYNEYFIKNNNMTMLYSLAITPRLNPRPNSKQTTPIPPLPLSNKLATPSTLTPIPSSTLQQEHTQPKAFKIRTYSHKNSQKQQIIGKKIVHITSNRETIEQTGLIVIKGTVDDQCAQIKKVKEVVRPATMSLKGKRESPFQRIQLAQRKQLQLASIDLSPLTPISHKPTLWLHPEHQQNTHRPCLLIVSFDLLKVTPTRFFKSRQRSTYHSQKCVQSPYSIQTVNFLSILCGQRSKHSFLNNCRLFFKVEGRNQMEQLKMYIKQHNFNNYEGIIDVRDKVCHEHSFYSLKGITNDTETVVLVEDMEVVTTQMPLLRAQQLTVLSPSRSDNKQLAVSKLLKSLRELQITGLSSFIKANHKNMTHQDQPQKQNINPNNGQLHQSHKLPQAHQNSINIYTSSELVPNTISLPKSYLMQKVKQHVESRSLRQLSQHKRTHSGQAKETGKGKTRHKSMERQSTSQDSNTIETAPKCSMPLEGGFKQKMVQYVKILQQERTSKLINKQKKQSIGVYQGERNQQDDLEYLTACVTSRIKSKTPYQLVGDLIRCNAHIARQIGRYLPYSKPVTESLREIKDWSWNGEQEWQIPVYCPSP